MREGFIYIGLLANFAIGLGQTAEEKILTNHKADDRYASYSPSGKEIVFESNRKGNWDIFVMDSDGKNQKRLTTNKNDDRRPSWHPSGEKMVFESNRSGKYELYELYRNTGKVKKIALGDLDGEPIFARYAPSGKKIAFSNKKSDQESNIAIVHKKGAKIRFLTDYNFRSFYPNWSPDGKMLLFFSRHETNNEDDEIYKMNSDGSGKERLTNWARHNFCPAWSNDGKKIAYVTSMEENRPEIYVMDANGENQLRITYNKDGDTLPSWSLDNTRLLITGYRNGNYEICELSISSVGNK